MNHARSKFFAPRSTVSHYLTKGFDSMKSLVITLATLFAGVVYGGELAPAQKAVQKSAAQKSAMQKDTVQKDAVQKSACAACDHHSARIDARRTRRAARRS
jgi:hypothetical protein